MNPKNPKHESIANLVGELVAAFFSLLFLILSHFWLFEPVLGFTVWNTVALFMSCYVASCWFRPLRVRDIGK